MLLLKTFSDKKQIVHSIQTIRCIPLVCLKYPPHSHGDSIPDCLPPPVLCPCVIITALEPETLGSESTAGRRELRTGQEAQRLS